MMENGRFGNPAVRTKCSIIAVAATVLFLAANGPATAACEKGKRIRHNDAECLTASWTNKTWPSLSRVTVRTECSGYGTVVAKIDVKNAADRTWRRRENGKWSIHRPSSQLLFRHERPLWPVRCGDGRLMSGPVPRQFRQRDMPLCHRHRHLQDPMPDHRAMPPRPHDGIFSNHHNRGVSRCRQPAQLPQCPDERALPHVHPTPFAAGTSAAAPVGSTLTTSRPVATFQLGVVDRPMKGGTPDDHQPQFCQPTRSPHPFCHRRSPVGAVTRHPRGAQAACESSKRISHRDSNCLTASWTNRHWPNATELRVKSECASYGKVVVKIDVKNAADWTWHLNTATTLHRKGFFRVREISCCSDLSDFCNASDLVTDRSCLQRFRTSPANETCREATGTAVNDRCRITARCANREGVHFMRSRVSTSYRAVATLHNCDGWLRIGACAMTLSPLDASPQPSTDPASWTDRACDRSMRTRSTEEPN